MPETSGTEAVRYRETRRSHSALPMTDTALQLIAVLAKANASREAVPDQGDPVARRNSGPASSCLSDGTRSRDG